jgi:hypothetical protein
MRVESDGDDIVVYYGGAEPGNRNFATIHAIDAEIYDLIEWLARSRRARRRSLERCEALLRELARR